MQHMQNAKYAKYQVLVGGGVVVAPKADVQI